MMTVELISQMVAAQNGMRLSDVLSARQNPSFCRAREMVVLLSRRHLVTSLRHIGTALGGRHRSTISRALANAERRVQTDPAWAWHVAVLDRAIAAARAG